MIKKDYIQRYFDELAKVLAVVLQLKNDLKPIEAEAKLNDFSTDFLGISFKEILTINTPIVDFLIHKKAFTLTHFKLLEDVLYHQYLIAPSNTEIKKITLEILKHTSKTDTNYSLVRANRIKELGKHFS